MGSLPNMDFGVFWASWGGSGNRFRAQFSEPVPGNRVPTRGIVPGSEGCEPEVSKVSVFDGFRGVRFCSGGLNGTGSGNRAEEKNRVLFIKN